MKCDCEDYNQCVSCYYYDECNGKPENPYAKYILYGLATLVITTIILIIK